MERWEFAAADIAKAELRAVCSLIEAVPEIEPYIDSKFMRWNEWDSIDGMLFMGELLRICDKLSNDPACAPILFKVFDYLEGLATLLETAETLTPLENEVLKFLLFTFTDNPTGKDPEFQKLSIFMKPKIEKMCSIC